MNQITIVLLIVGALVLINCRSAPSKHSKKKHLATRQEEVDYDVVNTDFDNDYAYDLPIQAPAFWTIMKNTNALGFYFTHLTPAINLCKALCKEDIECKEIDYNDKSKKCKLFNNVDVMYYHSSTNHYVMHRGNGTDFQCPAYCCKCSDLLNSNEGLCQNCVVGYTLSNGHCQRKDNATSKMDEDLSRFQFENEKQEEYVSLPEDKSEDENEDRDDDDNDEKDVNEDFDKDDK